MATSTRSYFVFLVLLSLISFGGHFTRSSLSMFGLYLINDGTISPAGLGVMLAACSLPSILIPLIVGHMIDTTKKERMITLVLFGFTIGGLLLFNVAICSGVFWLSVFALVVYGSGASSVTVIQRILVTLYLKENITFTTGIYIAMANVAKLLGKISVGPTAAHLGSWQAALVLPVLACVMSLLCYLVFLWLYGSGDGGTHEYWELDEELGSEANEAEALLHDAKGSNRSANGRSYDSIDSVMGENMKQACEDVPTASVYSSWTQLSCGFYWFAGLHSLYIMIFHSLVSFLPHYAYRKWGGTEIEIGFIASIPHIVIIVAAPAMGAVVDRFGHRTAFCTVAAAMSVVAYAMLAYQEKANPYVTMTLMSVSQGLIPALTLAQISRILPDDSVGVAFGIIEVLDSLVNVLGNVFFGGLYDLTGSYEVGMQVLLGLSVAGVFVFLFLLITDAAKENVLPSPSRSTLRDSPLRVRPSRSVSPNPLR
ncbi:major facilitator superfamily domain-containing protein [Ochromonadaceae sp. CCMP2298]|nr:major facilitator superfamily domain-containing protein [Ochromonadaceae sp. CCMP2298]|mmetsp:Transcript_10919/g.24201  ORF Transcript_10919/g.24201 Transcript_10919/m.24201 type:complete len:482 (+) Transcript_10919:233-1678(+)